LGDPPTRSVVWGRPPHFYYWHDPDPAGHWVPSPPYPKDERGNFRPVDEDVLTRAIELAAMLVRLGTYEAVATAKGIKVRALRYRVAQYRAELERRLLTEPNPDPGIAQVLDVLRRASKPGRPPKPRRGTRCRFSERD
jgi:hypothetical protein